MATNSSGYVDWSLLPPNILLDASYSGSLSFASNAFNTIVLSTVAVDTASGYNTTSGIYTIPVAGYWLAISKVRWADSSTSGTSFGQGVDTSNQNTPAFQWFVTPSVTAGTARESSLNVRLTAFNAGDQVRLFSYVDTNALTLHTAQLNLYYLGH